MVILSLYSCVKKPKACFSINKSVGNIHRADTLRFDASCSTNAQSFQWNFGDSSFAKGAQVSHRYLKDSIYAVNLVVTNGAYASELMDTLVVLP